MDPLEQTLKRSLASLRSAEARLPFYSTVTGERMAGEALDAGYWWRNVREPVQFARAVASLRASGASVFVEIGPHPVLRAPLGECLRRSGGDGRAIASMTRSGDGADALREKAFEVLVAGGAVDLARFFAAPGSCVDLPRYPWQRQRLERPRSAEGWDPVDRRLVHPLLGWRLPGSEPEWENPLDASLVPELGDHRVGGEVLLPASAFAEMALAAAEQTAERPAGESLELRELEIRAPLVLEAQRSKTVRLRLDPADGRFAVRSRARQSSDSWRMHANGRVVAGAIDDASPMPPAPQGGERVSAEAHYRMAAALGLDYGPAFQQVEELWRDGRAVTAKLKPPPSLRDAPALLHPASLDACFQLLLHAEGAESASAFVPVSIARLSLYRPRVQARFARLEAKRRGRRSVLADCRLYDASGGLIAVAEGVRFQAAQLKRSATSLSFIAERRVLKPVGAPAPLPSVDRLAAAARARLHAATRMQARERYFSDVEPLLEAMLGAFAARALADAGELSPERRALDQWLREFVAGGEFPDGREIWRHLLRDYPDHAEEIICLGGLGLRLPELRRGAAWNGPAPAYGNQFSQALADVLAEALRALPAGRRLRLLVLETGAASGLGRILAQLDEARCECVVLCPSERFADEPRALAARYPGTRVCVADLEQPRLERSPELSEPFDLVIAEQGAGWAQEPKPVLAHLRELTAAQGVLALGVPRASRASTFACELLRTIGFDAGFDSPLPGGEGRDWPELLRQSGFVDCLALPDMPEFDSGSSLLLARAAPRAAPALRGAWLLLTDSAGAAAAFALRLHAELERRGLRVQLRTGASDDLAGFDGVVQLAGLGAPLERQGRRCESLARLLEACASLPRSPVVWAVTARGQEDPAEAALLGFARSARNEYPQLSLRLADLAVPDDAAAMARGLADALLAGDAEDEIVVAAQGREVVRAELCELAAPGADAPGSIARLDLCIPGQIKGLCWTRQALPAPTEDEVEIEVRAAGLNFRDVMYATGQLADHALENGFAGATLGMELSGVVVAAGPRAGGLQPGDAVIAFAPASFATRARTRAAAVVKKPGDWSFEAAATVPATFLTAYYALHHLARLEEGQRVLIHGAAGGVGIAAIQIAQMAGAEIFCTAGSEAKRDFLRMLGVEHVFDSRSLLFADQVMAASAGEGLDVVLNSLAGEAMSRSLRLLKPFGRFLELGKRDFYEDTRIGLRPFANNIAYFGVDADQLMLRRPELTRRLLQDLMALFRQRQLAPLPYRAFAAADAVEAFRFMQQSKHIGKVVLSFDPPPVAKPVVAPLKDLSLKAEASYLVTGGTRGFGLRTAQWLAEKGARHLVLASASGTPDDEGRAAIAALRASGVEVTTAKCDVAVRSEVEALLANIKPPLRGVVHAAALIRDGLTRKLDAAQIDAVLAPKARGAALLDELTRGLPLDFFVLYSSATTVFGSPGQAAYVAANRSLEALAVARRAAGRPALCVSWGPIADAGYLARHPQIREALEARMGGTALEAEKALAVLEQMMVAGTIGAAVVRLDRGGPRLLGAAAPRLQALAARFPGGDDGSAESVRRWLEEFDDARLAEIFTEILKKEVGEILRIAPDKLDARQPLADIGLDSLMGVELMTAVEVRFGVNIPVMALAQANSIEQLVARIVRELRSGHAAPESGAAEEVRLVIGQHARDMNPEQMEELAAAMEAKRL
jgi:NADPH:quinone reductase-like Zn-dependent oxidoreductase/acyl carrier protein/malonyl CoA-acyl carrier protein transacylase